MNRNISHRLSPYFWIVVTTLCLTAEHTVARDLDVPVLGASYADVQKNFDIKHTVNIPPNYQAVVIQPEEYGEQNLLIFKNSTLISRELVGHKWDEIIPLAIDGSPGMVVSEWSGGAHCCFTYKVIVLQPALEVVQEIDIGDGLGNFSPCGHTTCLYIDDYTFAYWRGPFATTIHETIVLSLREGKFWFDPKLMRRKLEPLPEKKITEIKAAFHEANNDAKIDRAYRVLGQELLRLIYAGNARASSALVHQVWPRNEDAHIRDLFLADFLGKLKTSPYWSDLVSLNGGAILGAK